jgi:hypothetical protein
VAPGSALVTIGDVEALSRRNSRSSATPNSVDLQVERQEATWVVENFERARLWSGLVDRYRAWVLAS